MLRTLVATLAILLILAGCEPAVEAKVGSGPMIVAPNNGIPVWARTLSLPAGAQASFGGMATDRSGNVFAAGYLTGGGTFDFGGITATVNEYSNLFLAKYNAKGIIQWVKTAVSNPNNCWLTALTIDRAGSLYAAGYLQGPRTLDFGNGVAVTPTHSMEALVVKFDASGKARWAQTLSSSDETNAGIRQFAAVAVDATSVYVAGHAGSDNYPLLAKYLTDGTPVWTQTITTFSESDVDSGDFFAVAADGDGNVYAAGTVGTIGNPQKPFVAKFDSEGLALWSRVPSFETGSTVRSQYAGLVVDGSKNVVVSGGIFSEDTQPLTLSFGNGVVLETAAPDRCMNALLVKYDSTGTPQWARTVTAGEVTVFEAEFPAVTVDDDDNIYAAGYVADASVVLDFGNDVTMTTGSTWYRFPILARYDSAGTAQWVRKPSTPASAQLEFRKLSTAPSGAIVVTGLLYLGSVGFTADIIATPTSSTYGTPVLVKYE